MEHWLQLCTWIFKAQIIFTPVVQILALRSSFLYSQNMQRKMEKESLVHSNPKLPLRALWMKWQEVRTLSLPAFLLFAEVITLLHQDLNKCQSKVLSKLLLKLTFKFVFSKTLNIYFYKLIFKWNCLHFTLKRNGCWNTKSISEF